MLVRRRHERVPFFCRVTLTTNGDGAPVEARSFDIGLGGVGVITPASMERGQPVSVSFSFEHSGESVVVESIAGRVAYFRADEDGNYLGIEFLQAVRSSTHPQLASAIDRLNVA